LAPVRLDTGLFTVVPAFGMLNQAIEHLIILQEPLLFVSFSLRKIALICHDYHAGSAFVKLIPIMTILPPISDCFCG